MFDLVKSLCSYWINSQWQLDRKLMEAVENRDVEKAVPLLEQGADIHYENECGDTPLLLASWKQDARMVKLLCHHGANPNDQSEVTALMHTVGNGHDSFPSLETVRALLEAGADVNAVCEGDTVLSYMQAAGNADNEATVALLKKAGAKEQPS